MEEMNSQVKQDLKTLLLYLARGNVDRSNLYKFFLSQDWLKELIELLSLKSSVDELQQAWLKIKDSLP